MQANSTASRPKEHDQSPLIKHPPPSTPPPAQQLFYISVIRSESEAFGYDNTPTYSESNFVTATLHLTSTNIPDILRSLLWRGRQQSLVFQTFMALSHHGYCNLSALKHPVDYTTITPISSWMHNALMSYSAFAPLYERGSKVVPLENKRLEWQDFPYPLIWLEIMLVRSAVSIGDTFDAMTASGLLGSVDKTHFDQLPELEQEWVPDPEALVPRLPMGVPCFGLMLPSGVEISNGRVDAESIQREFYKRFNRIEEAFEKYFLVPVDEGFSLADRTDREFGLRD